ncbi:MAG: zinc ribbon domain-containing protein [Deltaproteobacteria bacterium]|nr:zinc ribbon domain-containing protein [Deltaproteobacteria bacterium]
MPLYSYTHDQENPDCERYPDFEIEQVARDLPLSVCPWCGSPVRRVMGSPVIKKRHFDCELRDKGFTKLVRVDDGLYENKTRRPGEEKYVDRRKPETLPILEKTIRD